MTLPFKENNSRKWQCFVCGRSHTDFTSFKEHIKEKHEEGRDYVLCPLSHCGAPVRDLKAHAKIKHLGAELPKTNQTKAIIWRDQGSNGRIKTKKPKFREGYLISTKNNGKEMFYRSGLECTVFEILEQINEVAKYDSESLRIPYIAPDGKQHIYLPDLSIQYCDGTIEIWEIKPSSQTSLPINEAKWAAANNFCKARGWEFIVLTEQGIQKLKNKIKQRQL